MQILNKNEYLIKEEFGIENLNEFAINEQLSVYDIIKTLVASNRIKSQTGRLTTLYINRAKEKIAAEAHKRGSTETFRATNQSKNIQEQIKMVERQMDQIVQSATFMKFYLKKRVMIAKDTARMEGFKVLTNFFKGDMDINDKITKLKERMMQNIKDAEQEKMALSDKQKDLINNANKHVNGDKVKDSVPKNKDVDMEHNPDKSMAHASNQEPKPETQQTTKTEPKKKKDQKKEEEPVQSQSDFRKQKDDEIKKYQDKINDMEYDLGELNKEHSQKAEQLKKDSSNKELSDELSQLTQDIHEIGLEMSKYKNKMRDAKDERQAGRANQQPKGKVTV